MEINNKKFFFRFKKLKTHIKKNKKDFKSLRAIKIMYKKTQKIKKNYNKKNNKVTW